MACSRARPFGVPVVRRKLDERVAQDLRAPATLGGGMLFY